MLCPFSSMPMERPPRRNDDAEGEPFRPNRAGEPVEPITAIVVGRERGMGAGLDAAAAATCAMVGVRVGVVAETGTLMVVVLVP
jgi:hypothetical protein